MHPDKQFRLLHLDGNLKIKPFDTLVEGTAKFSFRVFYNTLDSMIFSTPELKITKVLVDGMSAYFRTSGNSTVIAIPFTMQPLSDHSITFIYTAKPTDGLYFTGWNDPKQLKRKQVWAHRPDHWLPYTDGIITVNMQITTDERYKVFNNGVRTKVIQNPDHTKTWHYSMLHPHPFFSTSLVIGNYEYLTMKTQGGLPLELWYYPDCMTHAEPTYRFTPEMFNYFEEEFGFTYPYELYREAPVIDYMYGAMETTTSTIFGDYLMVDKRGFMGRNYINVNAHELAHQWFGNYISHLKTQDIWLTESFATYWAKKFEEHIFGEDYYQDVRNKELAEALEASKHDNYGVGHGSGGRARWYPKGSLVLDMLRDILGEDGFRASVKLYLESFPFQQAETSDFLQCIRKATGKSLEWFFEEWIYRGGEPEFRVSYEKVRNAAQQSMTRLRVEQVHATDDVTGLFKMPVDVEVHYTDGTVGSKTQWISEKQEIIDIPNSSDKEIDFVLFDPGRKLLKKMTFERSYRELISQARHAANMIDRYDALIALRGFPASQKLDALLEIYTKEHYHLNKGEIISQLASIESQRVADFIVRAIKDPDDKVRLAVAQNLKKIPFALKDNYEVLLSDSAFLTVELALSNLCSSFPDEINRYLDLTKQELGWRGRNIRVRWLEIAIQSGHKEFERELLDYTGESYEFETRINAAVTLKRLNLLDETAALNLMQGMNHWNYKIRNACSDALKYFYTQHTYRKMIDKAAEMYPDDQGKTLEKIRTANQ
jgi:aminopeptidase N